MRLKYNVFGQVMSVQRQNGEWLLYREPDVGMRSRIYEVVIPASLEKVEIAQYLDDIYHEMATEQHPTVRLLTE